MKFRYAPLVAIFSFVFLSCGAPPGGHQVEGSLDSSFFPAGVPVFVAEQSAVVGEEEGLLLTTVYGMYELESGELLVSDATASTVTVLDAETGEVLGSFGQADEGPGQLEFPTHLGSDALGRIWVSATREVISVFEPTDERGTYRPVHRFSVQEQLAEEVGIGTVTVMDPIPMGQEVGFRYLRQLDLRDHTKAPQFSFGLLATSPDGVVRLVFESSLISYGELEMIEVVWTGEHPRRIDMIPVAGTSRSIHAIAWDGRVAYAIPGMYAIDIYNADGQVMTRIHGPPIPTVHLTDGEREEQAERVVHSRASPDLQVTGDLEPEIKDPLRLLSFDRDGNLWAQLQVAEGSPVNLAHVFSPQGELIRVVVWPAEVQILGAYQGGASFRALGADRVWGASWDSFLVPTLVQLALHEAAEAEIEALRGEPLRVDSATLPSEDR